MVGSVPPSHDSEETRRDQERRNTLAGFVDQLLDELRALQVHDEQENAANLLEVVSRDTFKLLIMGEFKTGKSTFINALLREQVLPSYVTPTTAIINEVKYGAQRRALLHFNEPEKTPMEIPVDQLEEYVVIQESPEKTIAESPYSHVELFWDLDLCKNHVEIIDSPGLNENKVREKVTIDYLRKVDGIIFVMLAQRFWSTSERDSVELLERSGHKDLFFVINQFDLLDTEKDRHMVRQRAHTYLQPKTKRKNALHFVSARDALRGYTLGKSGLLEESGFPALEEVLREFLWEERSRVKARRAALELQLTIQRTLRQLPGRRQLLVMPLAELEQRVSDAQMRFDQVEKDGTALIRRYERFRNDMKQLVRGKVQEFFRDVGDQVEGWAKEYQLGLKFSLDVRGQINDAVTNVSAHLNTRLEQTFNTWLSDTLVPYVEDRLSDEKRTLERLAEDFEASLVRAQIELGIRLENDDLMVTKEGPKTALERVLAAAGGFFVSGVAGASIGALFGWREVVKAIIPQIMLAFAAGFLSLPLLPVLIIGAVIHGGFTTLNLLNRIKEETVKAYRQKLREISSEQADKVAEHIDQQLSEIQHQLERGVQVQIANMTEQVATARMTKQQSQAEVDRQIARIDHSQQLLTKLSVEVTEFIARLDQRVEGVDHNDGK